jgi:hypothetical protein
MEVSMEESLDEVPDDPEVLDERPMRRPPAPQRGKGRRTPSADR